MGVMDIVELDSFFEGLQNKAGLYAIYSVTGLGKRDLIMYVSQMLASRSGKRKPLVVTLEPSTEQWKSMMEANGLSPDGIMINDACFAIDEIRKLVQESLSSIVFIYRLSLVQGDERIQRLKELSKELSLPIVIIADLGRTSGDRDPVYRRPELFDIVPAYMSDHGKERTMGEFWTDIRAFDAILLLHRNHDWYRPMGGGHAYNICNEAELKIIRFGINTPPLSLIFDYQDLIPNSKSGYEDYS